MNPNAPVKITPALLEELEFEKKQSFYYLAGWIVYKSNKVWKGAKGKVNFNIKYYYQLLNMINETLKLQR